MAFDRRYQPPTQEICPICRQQYTDGRTPTRTAYHAGAKTMCKSCFRWCYKNRADGQTAGLLDEKTNPWTRFRPADCLERPRFGKKPEPIGGYEYRMPYLTEQQIVQDTLLWLCICVGMRLLLMLSGANVPESFCIAPSLLLLDGLTFFISAFWAVKDCCLLIKGCLLGMGHCRRLMLLGATLLFVGVAWLTASQYHLLIT